MLEQKAFADAEIEQQKGSVPPPRRPNALDRWNEIKLATAGSADAGYAQAQFLEAERQARRVERIGHKEIAAQGEQAIHKVWARAQERCSQDPDGAMTLAERLLVEVCRCIITAAGSTYGKKDELPKLYRAAAALLDLPLGQYPTELFGQIVGGLRNWPDDAPASVILVVNLSGSMAVFLLQTWQERQQAP